MPEITREEVRGWLQREMEINERARDTARELGLDTLALYGRAAARCRAALAALEDAERVEWLERRARTEGCEVVGWSDEDSDDDENGRLVTWAASYWVGDESKAHPTGDDSLRAAIDRARGA